MIAPRKTPWPEVNYRNSPDGDGQDASFYSEWWEIPGVARFDSEADAIFVRDLASQWEDILAVLRDAQDVPELSGRANGILKSICAAQSDR